MINRYSSSECCIAVNLPWPRAGDWTGTSKNPTKYLWRWEPDRRSNFFFSPTAHLCAVTYITEISLIVTLNNQFTSLTCGNFTLVECVFPERLVFTCLSRVHSIEFCMISSILKMALHGFLFLKLVFLKFHFNNKNKTWVNKRHVLYFHTKIVKSLNLNCINQITSYLGRFLWWFFL